MKSRIIVLIGSVFTVYGLILCIMSNLNLGVVLVAVFGIITLCIGLFYSKIKRFEAMRVFRICKILFILFLCAEIALV